MMSGSDKSDDFPTPKSLPQAHEAYAEKGRSPLLDETGKLLPFPASKSKASLIKSVDFPAID